MKCKKITSCVLYALCCFHLESLYFSHTFRRELRSKTRALLMISIDIAMMIIRLMLVLAFYENVETFPHKIRFINGRRREPKRKGKNLNPLSFAFDTIITEDFHCFKSCFIGLNCINVTSWSDYDVASLMELNMSAESCLCGTSSACSVAMAIAGRFYVPTIVQD